MATLISKEQLGNIIMECKDENTNYLNPKSYLNKDGTCKYAYVTLVMLGDPYIAGAILMAYSARKAGSNVDFVVLVTPDISTEGRDILGMFFTYVISVDYLDIPNWRGQKQKKKYLDLVFTKFHALELTQYEKIILIDADAVVLQYPDHLFTLDAPAGCLIETKELLISYDDEGNYIYPKDGKPEWYKKMCDCCGHGKKIPKEMTDKIRTNFTHSGIGGGLLLLEPKENELKNILKEISTDPYKKLVSSKFVWPEQQYLCLRYSGKWTSINPRFFGLQGYPHWSVLYGVQYGGDKPFILKSKMDIGERIKYPDFILWHRYYSLILEEYPSLKESDVLKDANILNPYFYSYIKSQKRSIEKINKDQIFFNLNADKLKTIISNLYGCSKDVIHDDQIKYFFLEKNKEYLPVKMQPMWDDIKEYDFIEPIKRLEKYFGKNSYYAKILKLYGDSYKKSNNQLDKQLPELSVDPIDKDLIALEYIKCRSKMMVVSLWPILMKNAKEKDIMSILKQYGNIAYVKKLVLSKKALFNLMFWMYDEFLYEYKHNFVSKKIDYVQSTAENEITLIFLDNVNNLRLSGQAAPAKSKLRNDLMNVMNVPNKKELRGNDLIHINDYFFQTVAYAQMVLNENSVDLLEKQETQNIATNFMSNPILKLQTFKQWTSNNLSLLQKDRILIMGGVILFSYGLRKSNDIDAIFVSVNNDDSESEQKMHDIIAHDFCNEDTKFEFADIGIEGSKYWKESWTTKNKQILNEFGLDNLLEVITDPRSHYYFQGYKCYLLDYEIIRKIHRNRKQDHADFIFLSNLYPELISKYVTLKNNKLKYAISEKITSPELKHDYLKELIKIIYNKYPMVETIKLKQVLLGL